MLTHFQSVLITTLKLFHTFSKGIGIWISLYYNCGPWFISIPFSSRLEKENSLGKNFLSSRRPRLLGDPHGTRGGDGSDKTRMQQRVKFWLSIIEGSVFSLILLVSFIFRVLFYFILFCFSSIQYRLSISLYAALNKRDMWKILLNVLNKI